MLTRHDWKVLESVHSILHNYYEATLCSEGNNDHLGHWFCTLDFIFSSTWNALCHFRDLKEENPGCPEYVWLEGAAKSAWKKCEQYYKRADESAAYYAAEILQPSRKWVWLHTQWDNDPEKRPWLNVAQKSVEQLWNEEYKGKFNSKDHGKLTTRLSIVHRPRHPNDEFGSLSEHRKIKDAGQSGASRPAGNSYLSFFNCGTEEQDVDPLEFWNFRIRSEPDLARFALDMLAIPVSSSECERIFSSAKLLITSSRNRLRSDIIEANECLRDWFGRLDRKKKDEDSDFMKKEDTGEDWGSGRESDENDENDENDEKYTQGKEINIFLHGCIPC